LKKSVVAGFASSHADAPASPAVPLVPEVPLAPLVPEELPLEPPELELEPLEPPASGEPAWAEVPPEAEPLEPEVPEEPEFAVEPALPALPVVEDGTLRGVDSQEARVARMARESERHMDSLKKSNIPRFAPARDKNGIAPGICESASYAAF
jgi:hypothetical protein